MKVISVMAHPPAYDSYRNQPRPLFHWDTSQGSWVGIWGYDWPDLLGTEIRKIDPSLEYQVWQPDLRADTVYEQTLKGGVVHRLFPAISQRQWWGATESAVSAVMLRELEGLRGETDTILHLNYIRGLLCDSILDRKMGFPTVLEFHGTISLPAAEFWSPSWNVEYKFGLLRENVRLKKRLQHVHLIVCKNGENVDALRSAFAGTIKQITMGVDFDFWKRRNKSEARSRLHLPQGAFIFLTVSRLVDLKQIDRFIRVLNRIISPREVLSVIVGDGEASYVEMLKQLTAGAPNGVHYSFPGYVWGSELLDYYSAADIFVNVSLSEGASVACMEAMACEVPVLTTNVGGTAEVFRANGKNIVVGKKDYRLWEAALRNILEGRVIVEPVPRNVALSEYHWPIVAKRFLLAYAEVMEIAGSKS